MSGEQAVFNEVDEGMFSSLVEFSSSDIVLTVEFMVLNIQLNQ